MAHASSSNLSDSEKPAPVSIFSKLSPSAICALENILIFYAGRKVDTAGFNGKTKMGLLEIIQIWVEHGNAVTLFETYELYLETIAELVAAFGGVLTDMLRVSPEDVEPQDILAAVLYKREAQPHVPTLHPAARRETYETARRLITPYPG